MSDALNPTRYFVQCDAMSGPLHIQLQEHLSAGWTVLFGPSGSGKSTLLRLIAGLWTPSASRVMLGGDDLSRVAAYRRRIVLVAQQPALFPNRTVRDNVAFGCHHPDFVLELLEAFELQSLAAKYPALLSGGEQQRTALARAIAAKPRLLLLDEAFTGMHRPQQQRLIDTVRSYSKKLKMPVLSVTHDVAEAFLCGDEVMRIDSGSIVGRGAAEQVLAAERASLLNNLA